MKSFVLDFEYVATSIMIELYLEVSMFNEFYETIN